MRSRKRRSPKWVQGNDGDRSLCPSVSYTKPVHRRAFVGVEGCRLRPWCGPREVTNKKASGDRRPLESRPIADNGVSIRAETIITMLSQVRSAGTDRWTARCPAHEDRSPSLTIRQTHDRILIHCWAGCTAAEICA